MNKKGTILCTALLLSSSMVFAADTDTTEQSDGASTTTNNSNGDTTTSTPSSTNATDPESTGGTSTDSVTTTPSTDSQGSQTGTPTNSNDTTNVNTDINVDANVTEVNNKAVIQGVKTAPTFTSVEFRDNVYYLPDTVTPVQGFYFLNIDSTERVCSLKKITKITVLSTPTTTTVMIGKKKQVLYCYDRSYFNF